MNCGNGMITSLSAPPLSPSPPCFSSTPTTSNGTLADQNFVARAAVPAETRLVATSAPMTQTGRPPLHSAAERNRPCPTVKPPVISNCSVVPMTLTSAELRFLYFDRLAAFPRHGHDHCGEVQLPLQCAGRRRARWPAAFAPSSHSCVRLDEPAHAIHIKHVRADGGNAVHEATCSIPRWPCP